MAWRLAPSHYLNQCWNSVNWNLRNKFQGKFIQIYTFSFKKYIGNGRLRNGSHFKRRTTLFIIWCWSRVMRIRIRIRNLYCPYFTEKHQGTRKYINKDIWIPTHYKQTKILSENTKQWYKIIDYNVERKWQWNDLYTLWHIPQAIAAIIHPEDTESDEGATAVKRYNRCWEILLPIPQP